MRAMRPEVESIAAWLLDGLNGRERFDFIGEFAGPLPCLVIMAMLGVPREELGRVKQLSDRMALFIGSSRTAPAKYDVAEAATREMAAFFRELVSQRRAAPREDLLSELVAVRDGNDRLTDDELVATCILLLFAGHETTTNLIANGLLALMRFPAQMQKLRDDPSRVNAAVEELLRFDGPSAAQVRIVRHDHVLHGKPLREGDRVFLMLNAADRDPRAFERPDEVDIDRDGVPHLAFGYGLHICLGFPLARTEGQVAFPAVLQRWAHIEPQSADQAWLESLVFRGMKSLPVVVRHH
jgi:cytochrome P450